MLQGDLRGREKVVEVLYFDFVMVKTENVVELE